MCSLGGLLFVSFPLVYILVYVSPPGVCSVLYIECVLYNLLFSVLNAKRPAG